MHRQLHGGKQGQPSGWPPSSFTSIKLCKHTFENMKKSSCIEASTIKGGKN